MSQSHSPTDSQGLLQSMLQRLKLQPGKEDQPFLHTPASTTAVSTWVQDGEKEVTNPQKVNSHPVNGFEFGTNGNPAKEDGISAVDSHLGPKGGYIQQPGHDGGMDKGLISFPSQKDNTDNVDGSRVLGEVTLPEIGLTGKLFPAQSQKGPDITSFQETDGEIVTFASSAMSRRINGNKDAVTTSGKNQMLDHGFRPKVYLWSLNPTDANVTPGSQEDEVLHEGFVDLVQSKDMQFDATSHMTQNSSSRRKQRSSENKTRRWTQRIKERWMDRSGSFGKNGREEAGRVDQKSAQGAEISPQKQLQMKENLTDTVNKEEERTLLLLDTSDPSVSPSIHTEEGILEDRIRSSSDFEFGLGSFSLLEEIVTGQEWAKFLNPNLPATSANQRPSDDPLSQLKSPSNPYDNGQPSLNLNQRGGNDLGSFRGTGSSPVPDQISPDAFLPVSMDVSEEKQKQDVHRLADHSEPMEDWQSGEKGQRREHRPLSVVEVADILANSRLNRIHRKRQHRTAEGDERLHPVITGTSLTSLSMTQSQMMDETGESLHDIANAPNCLPTPLSPYFKPFAPAPRGVLKQPMSSDSEFSMETVKKRRRVEENRRVHFSEEVVLVDPPKLDVDATDSEEDSGGDDDSVIEQEYEVEQAVMEEASVAARRPALPAWIRALKRRNTGRQRR